MEHLQITEGRGGATIRLRVKPGARTAGIVGVHGGALKLSVRAAPERGRANGELLELLAKLLDLPSSALSLVSGAASRDKSVRILGLTPSEIRERLSGR
jgi:hypothetical protein